jgi:hypothetical protein
MAGSGYANLMFMRYSGVLAWVAESADAPDLKSEKFIQLFAAIDVVSA